MKQRIRLIASFCMLFFAVLSAAAQDDLVKGTVVSASGEPLIGVGIVVKGAPSRGTVTDLS